MTGSWRISDPSSQIGPLVTRRWLVGVAIVVLSVACASAALGKQRGGASFVRTTSGKGVSARAAISYRKPIRRPNDASVPKVFQNAISPAPVTKQSTLSSTPPLSVCQTRTFPATKCAYYSFAPPPETDPKKEKDKKRPSPEELAAVAADRAIALAPDPNLSVAPSGIGLTGLPSFFWLAETPSPITATAGVGGLTVTAEARPIQFVWDFGDGVDKVTANAGRRWTRRRSGNISHLYETKGRYDLRVEVVWEARWRIGNGPWQPLGYFSNSDERPYPVREVVAILVRAR
jgi:hypothetical protein